MKTQKNIGTKNSTAVILLATAFLISSCKKEDLAPTTSGNVASAGIERQNLRGKLTEANAAQVIGNDVMKASQSIIMIKINHTAARTHAPDYSVTIKFDGTIIFEGRRNVAFIGTKEWRLATDKFINIKLLFDHSGFNSIEDRLSPLADVPMITTTWCASPELRSKTLFDYNTGYPEGVISLRQKAETILDLSQYISYLQPSEAKVTLGY